jgi:hypothetical protein
MAVWQLGIGMGLREDTRMPVSASGRFSGGGGPIHIQARLRPGGKSGSRGVRTRAALQPKPQIASSEYPGDPRRSRGNP